MLRRQFSYCLNSSVPMFPVSFPHVPHISPCSSHFPMSLTFPHVDHMSPSPPCPHVPHVPHVPMSPMSLTFPQHLSLFPPIWDEFFSQNICRMFTLYVPIFRATATAVVAPRKFLTCIAFPQLRIIFLRQLLLYTSDTNFWYVPKWNVTLTLGRPVRCLRNVRSQYGCLTISGALASPGVLQEHSRRKKKRRWFNFPLYSIWSRTTKLTRIYIQPNNCLLRNGSWLSYTTSSGVSRHDEEELGRRSSGRGSQPEEYQVYFSPNHRNNELGFPLPHTPNQVLIPTRCRSKLDY